MSLKQINTQLHSSASHHPSKGGATHGINFIGYRVDLYLLGQAPTAFGNIDFITDAVVLRFPAGEVEIEHASTATELLPLISKAVLLAPEFPDRATVVVHEAFRFRITKGCNRECLADSLKVSFEGCPDLLSQAYVMGSAVDRLPYSQYLDGYDKNGYFEVIFHGSAPCINGVLQFHPDGRVSRSTPMRDGKWRIQVPGEEECEMTLSADDLEFSDQQAGRRSNVRKARGPEH